MNLIELYKLHINPDADGVELFDFFKMFDIKPIVWSLNPKVKEQEELREEIKITEAMKWIFKNSKL